MTFRNAESIIELTNAYSVIKSIGESYPNFSHWYFNKVVPSAVLGNDKVIMGYSKNNLVGVSIIKNDGEKKLRALRLNDKYQRKGYGLHLIDESLKQLSCNKPLCSVSGNMINDFSRIFINRYDFDITQVYNNLYYKGILEYQFNGSKNDLLLSNLPY